MKIVKNEKKNYDQSVTDFQIFKARRHASHRKLYFQLVKMAINDTKIHIDRFSKLQSKERKKWRLEPRRRYILAGKNGSYFFLYIASLRFAVVLHSQLSGDFEHLFFMCL